jgi:hypothetical protein
MQELVPKRSIRCSRQQEGEKERENKIYAVRLPIKIGNFLPLFSSSRKKKSYHDDPKVHSLKSSKLHQYQTQVLSIPFVDRRGAALDRISL